MLLTADGDQVLRRTTKVGRAWGPCCQTFSREKLIIMCAGLLIATGAQVRHLKGFMIWGPPSWISSSLGPRGWLLMVTMFPLVFLKNYSYIYLLLPRVLEAPSSTTPYLNKLSNLPTGFPTSQLQFMLLLDQCSYQSPRETSFLKTICDPSMLLDGAQIPRLGTQGHMLYSLNFIVFILLICPWLGSTTGSPFTLHTWHSVYSYAAFHSKREKIW